MKKLKILHSLIAFLNLLAIIALLLGYLAAFISPAFFWPIAFFGLALPYLLIINLAFLIYWVIRGHRFFFFILIVFALGYKSIPTLIQFNFDSIDNTEKKSLKVLSFNVRLFDLYMWSAEKKIKNKIFEFLEREDPDILCLQEFFYKEKYDPNYPFETLDSLVEILTAKNYHVEHTISLREIEHFGIITFSKYPIIHRGLVPFKEKSDNICIYTDILLNKDTIRVYNGHLASIKLDKYDYKAVRGINKNEYSEDFGKEKMIFNKLKQSFQLRAIQADSIHHSIEKSPYPVIFCGDFNDTPSSYAYRTIRGSLTDAFMNSGNGLGQTYIGDFPSFRIDNIFLDEQFDSDYYRTHSEKLSDHHPISTKIYLTK